MKLITVLWYIDGRNIFKVGFKAIKSVMIVHERQMVLWALGAPKSVKNAAPNTPKFYELKY